MLSSSIDTLWGILWKRFKIHVLKNMSGWVLLNTKSLKHLGFKTFWFWKRFDIFEPDIRSIIGFSAPWNTHGVYLHIRQSRQFRKKSLCWSVYTHRLVCNGINIACSLYKLDKFNNHKRESASSAWMTLVKEGKLSRLTKRNWRS